MTEEAKVDGWRNMLQLSVGCWLIAAPFLLKFFSDPAASAVTICLGSAIALVSLLSIAKPLAWGEWVNLVFAAAVILSPWIVGFVTSAEGATWNALAAGTALAILSVNSLGARRLLASPKPETPTPPGW